MGMHNESCRGAYGQSYLRSQSGLFATHVNAGLLPRCKGQRTTYRFKVHGADVIEGNRVICPECGGEGWLQTAIYQPTPFNESLDHH